MDGEFSGSLSYASEDVEYGHGTWGKKAMVDPVTVNRGLAQAVRGSDVGTWDLPVNGNFGLLDTITGGITNIATTGGATTLNAAQLACGTLSISGALVALANIVWPSVQGWWTVENLTTGNFPVFLQAGGVTQQICAPPAEIVDIQVNGSTVKYRNLGRIGSYLDYAGISTPDWVANCTIPPYLNCDGSIFNSTTYPRLSAILGGNTLPDLRGRARFYLNGGTNRITTAVSGINGDIILSAGGDQNLFAHGHSFTTGGMNSNTTHTHTNNAAAVVTPLGSGPSSPGALRYDGPATINATNIDHTHSGATSTAGAGVSQNMPPATISGITLIRAG